MYYFNNNLGYLNLEFSLGSGLVKSAFFTDGMNANFDVLDNKNLHKALDFYFNKKQEIDFSFFEFPEYMTDFQKKVFQEILKVSFGKTITYQQIAKNLGKPNAYRAVAGACSKNPLALFIPCHRVVRSQNEDYGYSWGKNRKKWLLEFEKE